MISSIISRLVILVFGTLYPAYASYKAVRTKNLKEYVKWMMYWIVFALFTCTETFTDVFLSWFPFYYEVKIVLVLWLLSPATKGSSILYRKFVHPALCRREQEIDEYIAKAKDQGYHTVLNLGTKGVNYATTVIMQTAIKGGGGLVQQIKKSYSLSDLTECEPLQQEAEDVLAEQRVIRRTNKSGYNTRRSASESSRSLYFPEVDVDVRSQRSSRGDEPDFSHIKSTEDISSGYSSADNSSGLSRAGSIGARARARPTRTTVTTIKRPPAAEGDVIIEELHDDDTFEYANMPPLLDLPSPLYLSNTDPPFLYHYVGDQIRIVQVLGTNPLVSNTNTPLKKDEVPVFVNQNDESLTDIENTNVEKDIKLNNDTNNNTTFSETYKNEDQVEKTFKVEESTVEHKETVNIDINNASNVKSINVQNSSTNLEPEQSMPSENVTIESKEIIKPVNENTIDDQVDANNTKSDVNIIEESTSLETSSNFNDSGDSDDEASFGTPDDSPKSKRKSPKGKYGKAKAPPPPVMENKIPEVAVEAINIQNTDSETKNKTTQENLTDIVNQSPDLKTVETTKTLHAVNPIAENKRRHKSKSPGRIPKASSSGIGKLLHIPAKLAFWNKNDDKSKDNASNTSTDSRRSSVNDKQNETLLNIDTYVYNKERVTAEDQLSFKDAIDVDEEVISHDIIEKSDALQRTIEATIENHPEYKFVPLQEDVPSSSKSTDV